MDIGTLNWLSIVLVLAQLNYHDAIKDAQKTSTIIQCILYVIYLSMLPVTQTT
jgi:hypothetical protein